MMTLKRTTYRKCFTSIKSPWKCCCASLTILPCSDIIDTEPAVGDIYKMFLGSILPNMDEHKNIMNSAGLEPPTPVSPNPSVVDSPPDFGEL